MRCAFLGGPFDGARADISRMPPVVSVGGHLYDRIDDPDTGEWLGGYVTSQARGLRATLSTRADAVRGAGSHAQDERNH